MKAYIVEREALAENIRTLVGKANGTPIWGVLKGNGYGIGVIPFAKLLWENGVDRFAVTELREAELLRENYPDAPILMLRSVTDEQELQSLLNLNVILAVGSLYTAELIDRLAAQSDTVAEIHLCIDTGMGRYGFLPEDFAQLVSVYQTMEHLAVSGMFTHFHSAFCSEKATRRQFDAFCALAQRLQKAGYETGMLHCCNSAAFLRHPEMYLDAVRIGSAFLGRVAAGGGTALKRIGYAECTVEELRWLPAGHTVGYGAGFRCRERTQIAVIGIGWANGFGPERENDLHRLRDNLRALVHAIKNLFLKGDILVTVDGKKCRILGHIGMVHAVVDVTGENCRIGSRVVVQINPLHVRGLKIHYR